MTPTPLISLLQGNKALLQQLKDAEWVGISIISQLEFLIFPNLSDADKKRFNQFLQRVNVIGLTTEQLALMATIIDLRRIFSIFRGERNRVFCVATAGSTDIRKNSVSPPVY